MPIQFKSMSYTGTSMNPILRAGDGIWFMPYDGKKIRRGDVVVFTPPEGDSKIIHRVVACEKQGIRTKGDNNSDVDQFLLSPDKILGQVVYARRGRELRKIYGGTTGRMIAGAIRIVHSIKDRLFFLLRPAYRWFIRTGVFKGWVSGWMKTRIVSFKRLEGTELQLMVGRYVIGRLLPGRIRWHIRRPFRIFFDEATLPKSPSSLPAASDIENPRHELTGKSHSKVQEFYHSISERRASHE